MLWELCRKYTDLDDDDIAELENYAKKLKCFADLTETDLFIDCLIPNTNYAIVVYQQWPEESYSLFSKSVVGEIVGFETEPAVIRTLKTGLTSKNLKALTKEENKVVYETAVPIRNSLGKIIGALVREYDVTEQLNRKKQIEILQQTQQKLLSHLQNLRNNPRVITEYMDQAVIIFDHNNIAVYVNSESVSLYKKLGYIDDIHGMHMKNLVLDSAHYSQLKEGKAEFESEVVIGDYNLHIRYAWVAIDNTNCIVMLIRDISEVRNKEKELILKSIAVKEIHHRVKNNLQTIASILTMQAIRTKDVHTKKILQENIRRISSIAATHEALSGTGLEQVDIKEIIKTISNNIEKYAVIDGKEIDIIVEGNMIFMEADRASDIALVLNELLSNSLQHGFSEREKGTVKISIVDDHFFYTFTIEDDGIGFQTKGISNSMGLNIVKAIVKDKLQGSLNIYSDVKGTKAEFNVKK